jgi:hypothetical protein
VTCVRSDLAHSTFDVPLVMANERTAAFRGEARRTRLTDDGLPGGAVRRLRHGVGHRLIAVGSALVAERRSQTLAR